MFSTIYVPSLLGDYMTRLSETKVEDKYEGRIITTQKVRQLNQLARKLINDNQQSYSRLSFNKALTGIIYG